MTGAGHGQDGLAVVGGEAPADRRSYGLAIATEEPYVGAAQAAVDQTGSPREAAAGADVVIDMVTDDSASRAIWTDRDDGALSGMRAGAVAVESSTVTPA